jgi:hypothetical protein
MHNSRKIASLVGPVLVAMLVSESPLVQPHLYDAQIPPVICLSGVLLFTAGLARETRQIASRLSTLWSPAFPPVGSQHYPRRQQVRGNHEK